MINKSQWIEIEVPCHFCAAKQCRFYRGTVIGDYLISSVGEWIMSPEMEELEEKVKRSMEDIVEGDLPQIICSSTLPTGEKMHEISFKAFYETMVFDCEGLDENGLPIIKDYTNIDGDTYNFKEHAEQGHERLCIKYAKKQG